jgi:hypothetical protein
MYASAPVQERTNDQTHVRERQQGHAIVDQFQADDLQGRHEEVADNEDVVGGSCDSVEAVPRLFGAKVGGGGVGTAVAEAQEEEEREEQQRKPGREGDEDAIGEAGGWERGRKGGVRALGRMLALVFIAMEVCTQSGGGYIRSLQDVDCRTTWLFLAIAACLSSHIDVVEMISTATHHHKYA